MAETLIDMTDGRGPDGTIDAVGMEAHGSPAAKAAQAAVGLLPDAVAQPHDRPVRRRPSRRAAYRHQGHPARGDGLGLGVYGGEADPMPMMELFDRGMQLRMGQCHVKRWIDDILPLVLDDADPLGTGDLATHLLPLGGRPTWLRDLPGQEGRVHQGAA